MTSILWEKLGLHTPPEADLEPRGGEVPLLSRPGHSKYSLIWPQSCQLGQYSSTPKSWADPGPAPLLQRRD